MMNDKTLKRITAWIGFFLITLSGILLHFAFEASGGNSLVGAFTPVNESVWEHLKLLLYPTILYAIVEYFLHGQYSPSFLAGKIYSLFLGMLLIVCGHYTYTGILGQRYTAIDIGLFVAASALTVYLSYNVLGESNALAGDTQSIVALLLLTVMILFFIYFTFHPPLLELFRDPITEDFGIKSTSFLLSA